MDFSRIPARLAIGTVLALLCLTTWAEEREWVPIKSLHGVQVYSRLPAGSGFREFYGEIEVVAKPDRVVRLLQDLEGIPDWHYMTREVRVLDLIDLTRAHVHIINASPWPVRDRDAACRVSLVVNEGEITITITSLDDLLPASEDYIRADRLDAEWRISPAENGGSRIRYRVHVEPGGAMPRWLFNSVAMDIPLRTLLNLRRRFAAE